MTKNVLNQIAVFVKQTKMGIVKGKGQFITSFVNVEQIILVNPEEQPKKG